MLAGLLFGAGLLVGVGLTTVVLRDRLLSDIESLNRQEVDRLRLERALRGE